MRAARPLKNLLKKDLLNKKMGSTWVMVKTMISFIRISSGSKFSLGIRTTKISFIIIKMILVRTASIHL